MSQGDDVKAKRVLLNEPRERHYTLGHIALRQICEQDCHYLFSIMAAPERTEFLTQLITQVEQYCPDDSSIFDAASFRVITSRVLDHPLLLIEMPKVEAYIEAIYVGIVSMIDITRDLSEQTTDFRYYTLELAEGDSGDCYCFCQWDKDTHYSLAELEAKCSLEDFGLLICQQVEDTTH